MKSIIIKISILTLTMLIISCGASRRQAQNGFSGDTGNYESLGIERNTGGNSADLGSNCPITDFTSAAGAPLMADVFWPFEFDVLNLRADGNGYYILYEDLMMLGISGPNPCNLLQIEYGIDASGSETGTGYYDFYTFGNGGGVSQSCKTHIMNDARVAMISEDANFDNSCAVFF